MTAGTGVSHSEANPSSEDPVHLLQIWIMPKERGLEPGYEQKLFTHEQKQGSFCLIASSDGRDGSVKVHQDVSVYGALMDDGQEVDHQPEANRHAWIQVARGAVAVNGEKLEPGDGAAVTGESKLTVTGQEQSEILLFDLA